MRLMILSLCLVVLTGGCMKSTADKSEDGESKSGIIGKETQDIGEFDPNANANVSDGKMKTPHPLNPLGAMNAYGPLVEKLAGLNIDHALSLYQAEHGRYPKTHKEFMDKVIKRNGIKLPKLPGGAQYQYDVANHKLVVVNPDKSEDN